MFCIFFLGNSRDLLSYVNSLVPRPGGSSGFCFPSLFFWVPALGKLSRFFHMCFSGQLAFFVLCESPLWGHFATPTNLTTRTLF